MNSKIGKIKENYDKYNKKYNKEAYNEYAKVIVGAKTIKHVIFKLPQAIKDKKNDTNDYENSLYKKNSVLDYIENPDFEYNEEVERVSNRIEEKINKVNEFINKARKLTNPLYWIKKLIDKTRKDNIKLLEEGSNLENKDKEKVTIREDREKFVEELRNNINNEEINIQNDTQSVEKKIKKEQDYEMDI